MTRRRPRPHAVARDDSNVSDEEVTEVRADAIDRAERTLDVQRERFDRIDEKASRILRVVAVLSGIVFALFGLGPAVGVQSSQFRPSELAPTTLLLLTASGVSFAATVLLAAATYVTTRFRSSFSATAVTWVKDNRFGTAPYQRGLLDAYEKGIRENRPRIRRNRYQFVATLCALVVSIATLSATAIILLVRPSRSGRVPIAALALIASIVFVFWVVVQLSD